MERAPVMMVDWHCAAAYAHWLAERTGASWRLPWDFEWEKAARGVDGRAHPWGNGVDPTYGCYRDSHEGRALPQVVDSFPLDESPYGIRSLGGNVFDWCVDVSTKDGALPSDRIVRPYVASPGPQAQRYRVIRGGYWIGHDGSTRAANRREDGESRRAPVLGFRLVRGLAPDLARRTATRLSVP